ncbi:NmrA family NAD(P)-binding protein [Spirosoma sp. BT702]|uniref:NmrA family NAD(P)-binding protein n=1 Tax=Spirosoma profusum TaxID=2771354 RepID=A0A927AWU1_9BACT|nr:NmrA family NAD(P)-binding protein [Spirosoma profusum]MBD2705885.1 NmrA family NAD(P)-binding protein [Spirosoma profusum]
MFIILGATGHVGSAVAQSLLDQGEAVTVITHDAKKKQKWQHKGATVALADVHDADQLHRIFQQGKRLFVLNPPAPITTDTAQKERQSIQSILAALMDSGIEKIVAQSTYGAQPGERVGDLGVLYELEQGLRKTGIPTSIIRAAYYMSNWDTALATAQQAGQVPTLYPPAFTLPMVAPQDVGSVGAALLQEPVQKTGLHYVEGPQRYSSADVAAAFTDVLGKDVEAVATPREAWAATLQQRGFSQQAAESMATMTAITLDQTYELPNAPIRGTVTLQAYISALVKPGE